MVGAAGGDGERADGDRVSVWGDGKFCRRMRVTLVQRWNALNATEMRTLTAHSRRSNICSVLLI